MHEQYLVQAGLSKEEALVYNFLIENGPKTAGLISRKTALKRGLSYKVLAQLVQLGLVERKEETGKVALFIPAHPLKLKEVAEKKEREAKDAQIALGDVLDRLISSYNLASGKPGVTFFEGRSGIERVYNDVIRTKSTVHLIRSVYDNDRPELAQIIPEQIRKQVAADIHVRAITPLDRDTPATVLAHDAKNLVERRIIPRQVFTLPAQIMIYGNKVAITSLRTSLVTTLIDNPDIAETFSVMFEYIWSVSRPTHEDIYAHIMSGDTGAPRDDQTPPQSEQTPLPPHTPT